MRSFLKNILIRAVKSSGLGASAPVATKIERALPIEDVKEEGVPRYPPFLEGFPALPAESVLLTQAKLIEEIRMALGFNLKDFETLLLPVLRNYAAFVHFLPASEAHHHRGAGGLFRHGLEAAFAAAQASDGVIFSISGTPKERRDYEPIWRLASTLAALLHDIGKPVSDVTVTDHDGLYAWSPYGEFIHEWATRHNIKRYHLRWNQGRFKHHESLAVHVLNRMIPMETLNYLHKPGPVVQAGMMEALTGVGLSSPITKLMIFADKSSVSRDLQSNRLNIDGFSYGVPVERYLFDAIRRLINTGKWKVNQPGANVWHLKQGAFIVWRNLSELYEIFDHDKTPGIPRDPDTLADILIERGFALQNMITNKNGEEVAYRYWDVQPEGMPNKLLMLRFDKHELVFTNEPPAQVNAVIFDGSGNVSDEEELIFSLPDDDTDALAGLEQDGALSHPDELLSHDSDADDSDDADAALKTDQAASEVDALLGDAGMTGALGMFGIEPEAVIEPDEPDEAAKAEEIAPVSADEILTHAKETTDKPLPKAASSSMQPSEQGVSNTLFAQNKDEEVAAPGSVPSAVTVTGEEDATQNCKGLLLELFAAMPDAESLLTKAMIPVLEGQKRIGSTLRIIGGQVVIPLPLDAKELGDQKDVIATLSNAGALEVNPVMPGRKVADLGGIKCLALNNAISDAFKLAFKESGQDAGVQAPVTTQRSKAPRPSKAKPLPDKEVESDLKALDAKEKPAAASEQKQNKTVFRPQQRLTPIVQEEQIEAPVKRPVIDSEDLDEQKDEIEAKTVQQLVSEDDEESFTSAQKSIDSILDSFKKMMISGEGRWLVSPVTTNEEKIKVTCAKAIDQIVLEHPVFKKADIRRRLADKGFKVFKSKIYLVENGGEM